MKTIAAGEFKAKCLSLLDEVQSKREPIVITKRGKAVAKLVAVNIEEDDIFGFFEGKGTIVGDVVSPIFSPEEWGDLY
jgi:prevent-host-death family protein